MSPPAVANYLAGQFGDTTYTKVFVGGLAWETQRETMKKYFEQFGEILEAVVITDKNTGRSKGYGFVTYSEPESATRACVDPSPVIDGRRANCNLASLGVQRSTPQGGGNSYRRSFRVMKFSSSSFGAGLVQTSGGMGAAFPSPAHYAIQQGIPYNIYGYPPYSQDYSYPTSYYNVYGGAGGSQYPMYEGADGAFYPYFQFSSSQQGYSCLQYPPPHQMFHYSSIATSSSAITGGGFTPQFGTGPVSFAPNPHPQSVCFAIKQA